LTKIIEKPPGKSGPDTKDDRLRRKMRRSQVSGLREDDPIVPDMAEGKAVGGVRRLEERPE
jgi:hypothetical protein